MPTVGELRKEIEGLHDDDEVSIEITGLRSVLHEAHELHIDKTVPDTSATILNFRRFGDTLSIDAMVEWDEDDEVVE